MGIQRLERGGRVRYRARIKSHGREVATRVFDRKRDAVAWEQDQRRKLRSGEWIDPQRGRITLTELEPQWTASRTGLKRKTRDADRSAWENHIRDRFGHLPVNSITKAEIASWVGGLVAGGLSTSTASRYLSVLRSLLAFAVADGRLHVNVAVGVKLPGARKTRREGQFLTLPELATLESACAGRYAELVTVLGLCGLRWGELAGLQVGDLVEVPGKGLRLQRAVLASSQSGELYVDTLKTRTARTVPLPDAAAEIVHRWAAGKDHGSWVFPAPEGGPLGESNWRRSVQWSEACRKIGRPTLRPHDLRHTAASLWLAAGADPKVVQRVLGHASAAMTMDLYGHLVDHSLWDAANKVGASTGSAIEVGGTTGAQERHERASEALSPGFDRLSHPGD